MTNAAETRIGGRYRLRAALGSGSHGRVYLADDLVGGVEVAVKMAEGTEDVAALRREFELLGRLRHPNLPRAIDFGGTASGERAFLAMEFVAGEALDRIGVPSAEDAADLLVQACRGLGYLHARGVAHGDVKPSNLLVTRRPGGSPWLSIIDLGLSLREGEGERGFLRGTPRFAAPSVKRGEPPTPPCDLYSLGLCFRLALEGTLDEPASEVGEAARALAPVLRRLTEGDRDARYQRADRVVDEVVRIVPALRRREDGAFLVGADLVGRDAPLALLEAWLERSVDGEDARPPLLLSGASGMGKTRLLDELSFSARRRGYAVCHAVCPSGVPSPYEPLRDALVQISLLHEEGNPELASELRSLEELLRGTHAARAGQVGDEAKAMSLHLRLRRGLEAAAAERPLLLRVDDFQRADAPTASFLRHVARTRSSGGLAFAVAAQTSDGEDRPHVGDLEGAGLFERIELANLPSEDTVALAAAILGEDPEAASVAARIAGLTEGHAGFAEAAARAWKRERWRAGEADLEATIDAWTPSSLLFRHGERLRNLTEDQLRLAEELSVLTRAAPPDLIYALTELHAEDVPPALDVLRGVGVLVPEAVGGVRALRLESESLRRFVLRGLDEERLAALHRRAARAWTSVLPDPEERSELLVEHHLAGGEAEEALRHGIAASRKYVARQLFGEAVELSERLLDLGATADQEIVLQECRGDALAGAGRHDRARGAFARARELLAETPSPPGDVAAPVRILRKLGAADIALGEFESAHGHLSAALDGAGPDVEVGERARISEFLAITEYRLGRVGEAKERLRRGLEILEGADEDSVASDLRNDLGIVEFHLGHYERSAEHHRRALRMRVRAGDQDGQSRSLMNLANVALVTGDDRSARRDYEASLEIKRQLGNVQSIANVLTNLALLDYRTGRLGSAIARFEEAGRRQREISDVHGRILTLATLGEVWKDKGEPARAERLVRAAVRVARRRGHRESTLAEALASAAAVEIVLGRWSTAIAFATDGLEVATAEGLRPDESALLCVRGEAAHSAGEDSASAAADLARSIEIAREVGDVHRLSQCLLVDGERAFDLGATPEATERAEEVERIVKGRSAPLVEARARLLAGRIAIRTRKRNTASDQLHGVLSIAETLDAPELLWSTFAALGEFHLTEGRRRRGISWLRKCAETLDGVVGKIHDPATQDSYLKAPRRARALGLLEEALRG